MQSNIQNEVYLININRKKYKIWNNNYKDKMSDVDSMKMRMTLTKNKYGIL